MDAETGVEIFGKNADEIRPIASTTKIFVAMAVRKKGLDLDAWTEVSAQAIADEDLIVFAGRHRTSVVSANTMALPQSTGSRRGTAARLTRIVPVAYSPATSAGGSERRSSDRNE